MPQWDAAQYLKFATERTQPAIDLIQRIELTPRRIVDLGCGPGNSTEALRRRWPDAHIVGIDRSPEMIAAAKAAYPEGTWEIGDAGSWSAGELFDLVYANAMLHWLPRSYQSLPALDGAGCAGRRARRAAAGAPRFTGSQRNDRSVKRRGVG
jgi:trans-aconitate 2-methyltransferase